MTELERLQMNTNQAEADLVSVKNALQDAGVEIAAGTPSSEYGGMVGEVYDAGYNKAEQYISRETAIGSSAKLINPISELGLTEFKIYGNSVQNGTPMPDNPIEIQSVGNLITDETDEHYSKYDIPIELQSKNIFNVDAFIKQCNESIESGLDSYHITKEVVDGRECIKVYGVITRNSRILPVAFKENTQYTISFDYCDIFASNICGLTLTAYYTDGSTESVFGNRAYSTIWYKKVWISQPCKTLAYISCSYGTGGAYTYIANWQIEAGDNSTEYSSYIEPSIQHIYLDEPLRKVGGVSDCIDLLSGEIVRNIEVLDDTGSLSIEESFNVVTSPIVETISIPTITLLESDTTTIIYINTVVKCDINVRYYQKGSYLEGIKSEYDAFWDKGQAYGTTTDYQNAFSGILWNNFSFKPKYNLNPTTSYMMFRNSLITGDLVYILKSLGVELNFSNCSNFQYTFNNTLFTRIGVIDTRKSTGLYNTFQFNNTIKIIDEIILKDDGSQVLSNVFIMCKALESIKVSGTIGKSISFDSSPLNKASMESIVNALFKSATGQTLTLKKSAVDAAFETSEGANDGSTSTEWIDLITPYSNQYNGNWTISLV